MRQLKTLMQQQHKTESSDSMFVHWLCARYKLFLQFFYEYKFSWQQKNDQTEHFNRDAKSCCAPVYRELFTRSKGT